MGLPRSIGPLQLDGKSTPFGLSWLSGLIEVYSHQLAIRVRLPIACANRTVNAVYTAQAGLPTQAAAIGADRVLWPMYASGAYRSEGKGRLMHVLPVTACCRCRDKCTDALCNVNAHALDARCALRASAVLAREHQLHSIARVQLLVHRRAMAVHRPLVPPALLVATATETLKRTLATLVPKHNRRSFGSSQRHSYECNGVMR